MPRADFALAVTSFCTQQSCQLHTDFVLPLMQTGAGTFDVGAKPVMSTRALARTVRALARDKLEDLLHVAARHVVRLPIATDASGTIIDKAPDGSTPASIVAWYQAKREQPSGLTAAAAAAGCTSEEAFVDMVTSVVRDANKTVHHLGKRWTVMQQTIVEIASDHEDMVEELGLEREWHIFNARDTIRKIAGLQQ